MVKDLLEGANIYSDVLVYIVDKDKDFREKLILELKCQGLDACGFDSASSFYRAYVTQPASIVIIDNNLSGENGLSICNHLRNLQSLGIIMTIDRGINADCVRTIQACADAHLFKPVKLSELVDAVVNLINTLKESNFTSSSKSSGWALIEGGMGSC